MGIQWMVHWWVLVHGGRLAIYAIFLTYPTP
jgi:hypothetical protein